GQAKRQLLEEELLAEGFLQALGLDHHVAEMRPGRDVDLVGLVSLLRLGGLELLEARKARLAFGAPPLGIGAHPFELLLHRLDARGFLLGFDLEAALLLLEPARVIALPGNAVAAVELEDPAGDIVEKVAIV